MDLGLSGKRALVTGGSRGVGKAVARELAREGVAVAICARDGKAAEAAAAELSAETAQNSGRVIAFRADTGKEADVKRLVADAAEALGGLDILVNNAAILRDAFIFKGDPGDWDAVVRNNLSAAYYLTQSATQAMRAQFKAGRGDGDSYGWGRIVNIISTAGIYGNYGQASYGAAKGGLIALMRVTALEMARSAVTCNAVAPFAHTRVTDTIKPANDEQASYKERAMKVSPDHVARFVNYLCLPAARDVSGQIFGVRGREIFLFSQPRPIAFLTGESEDWQPESIARAMGPMSEKFTELATDLEAFNSEPIV
ncbi:MAG: SDR family NAD(P)-dependent oxidoreductase [Chloroflexi bacterium]|nr:SDR family NAD(P)-dependent oxidoreductase [Chloroflexota bacterium]